MAEDLLNDPDVYTLLDQQRPGRVLCVVQPAVSYLRLAYEDAVRRHETGPAAHAAQRAAYQHAGAQYERSQRRPRFHRDLVSTNLLFIDEREEGSLVAAVVGKLRGPVRPRATEMEVAR